MYRILLEKKNSESCQRQNRDSLVNFLEKQNFGNQSAHCPSAEQTDFHTNVSFSTNTVITIISGCARRITESLPQTFCEFEVFRLFVENGFLHSIGTFKETIILPLFSLFH